MKGSLGYGVCAILLNLPWSLLAISLGILCLPRRVRFNRSTLVLDAHTLWLHPAKGVRAFTLGNVIVSGPKVENNDLTHELVHIEQHMREPLIHPFLAFYQMQKYGYKDSKYEVEAYQKAGNTYKQK